MTMDVPGSPDVVTLAIICGVAGGLIILALYLVLKRRKEKDFGSGEPQEDVFRMVSRVKYPCEERSAIAVGDTGHAGPAPEDRPLPPEIDLLNDAKDMTASLRALVGKYGLTEITLATDDGLVFATSAGRDVEVDAVKYSQISRARTIPDDPGVSLFELEHRNSRLIGIISAEKNLPRSWKEKVREDTKVILQWWL